MNAYIKALVSSFTKPDFLALSIPHLKHLTEGAIITALVAALTKTAQKISDEQSAIVGADFFEDCVSDILDGGDGINLNEDGHPGTFDDSRS